MALAQGRAVRTEGAGVAYDFDVDDVAFLRSTEGRETVERLTGQPLTADSRMADVALARQLAGIRSKPK